jgi:glycosyltransferase involved in cell wall biosynthesis
VVNEAMCCGLPIITTKSAGCSIDLVENGNNGFIINSGDVEQLYRALLGIFESPVKWDTMSARSFEKIQRDFSVENTVEGFLSAVRYVRGLTHGSDCSKN